MGLMTSRRGLTRGTLCETPKAAHPCTKAGPGLGTQTLMSPPWEPRRLEDLGVTVKIPWDEIAQADGPLEQQRIILREVDAQLSQPCSHCNGTGNTGFISTVRCTKCDGTGRAQ